MLHIQGKATVGEIVSFMGFATLVIGRMESAVQFASRLFFQLPVLEDFFGVLDAKSSVPERPDAAALVAPQGEVVFEGVSFAYPGGPRILDQVSFTARPGMSVALVGQTGAGKSTAMNLLQRLWDPVEGTVRIDGQDLRGATLESLRRSIGVVFQESLLFNRSIRENLRIGRHDATDEELERACRLADAHEFIVRQPQGYDTVVGERGATLSGGQRQRLAIARALLKDPPILILDEATSALGRRNRSPCVPRHADANEGPHDVHHRPSPQHGAGRGRDPGVRRRPDRRTRQLRRADCPARPVRRPGGDAVGALGTARARCGVGMQPRIAAPANQVFAIRFAVGAQSATPLVGGPSMTVAAILKHKGRDVAHVSPTATVAEVVQALSARRIGAVLVLDSAGQVLGIVSERDVVRSLAEQGARHPGDDRRAVDDIGPPHRRAGHVGGGRHGDDDRRPLPSPAGDGRRQAARHREHRRRGEGPPEPAGSRGGQPEGIRRRRLTSCSLLLRERLRGEGGRKDHPGPGAEPIRTFVAVSGCVAFLTPAFSLREKGQASVSLVRQELPRHRHPHPVALSGRAAAPASCRSQLRS